MLCYERRREDKDDSRKSETPTPEVDEDGFCIRPKPDPWENEKGFYSSSDTDSEDERERKIRVEIKPLSNGGAPMSASVDELRATVENLSLSPAPTVRYPMLTKFHIISSLSDRFLKPFTIDASISLLRKIIIKWSQEFKNK